MKNFLRITMVTVGLLVALNGVVMCESPIDWAPITGTQYNMVAYGKVYLSHVDFSKGGYTLYSFGPQGQADCRSKSEIRHDGFYYATIVGNQQEEIITFRVLDSHDGQVYDLQDTLIFRSDETRKDFDIH